MNTEQRIFSLQGELNELAERHKILDTELATLKPEMTFLAHIPQSQQVVARRAILQKVRAQVNYRMRKIEQEAERIEGMIDYFQKRQN
jgi:uncharacterized protein (DUF3084 family)